MTEVTMEDRVADSTERSLRWEITKRNPPERHRIFAIRTHLAKHPGTGAERPFTVLDGPDWVNVIARTKSGLLVFVRQFRHGVERVTIEIPGGIVDPGESSEDAARRELLEETGYAADHWVPLGAVEPNPAIQTNQCDTWLALDAHRVAEPRPDDGEALETTLVAERDVPRLIADGEITHSLVVAGFARLWIHEGRVRGGDNGIGDSEELLG